MKVKVTFFINGGSAGKGSIGDPSNQYYNDIQRMLAEGHQIASHTWTHQDLSNIGHVYRLQQIIKNEKAIANNIGLVPTYLRPPYLSCDAACLTDLAALGYHIINDDLDTYDWQMNLTAAKAYYIHGLEKNPAVYGYNVLAHDIHAQTVRELVPYMVETLFARGYKPVTIGECLHDDPKNWYRHPVTGEAAGPARAAGILPVASGNPSSSLSSSVPTSSFASSSAMYSIGSSSLSSSGSSKISSASSLNQLFSDPVSSSGVSSISSSAPVSYQPSSYAASSSVESSKIISSASSLAISSSIFSLASSQIVSPVESSSAVSLSAPSVSGSLTSSAVASSSENNIVSSSVVDPSKVSSLEILSMVSSSESVVVASPSAEEAAASAAASASPVSSYKESSSRQSSARPSPSSTPKYSPDGTCGGRKKYTCPNGQCCSKYNFCGSSSSYCRSGCQKRFGACYGKKGPVSSGKISPDYTCGGSNGYNCPSNLCCSRYGWCGSTSAYCRRGCQSLFGKC